MTKRELASIDTYLQYCRNEPLRLGEPRSEAAEGYFSATGMSIPHLPSGDIPYVLGMPTLFHAVLADFRPMKMGAFDDICSGFVVNRQLYEVVFQEFYRFLLRAEGLSEKSANIAFDEPLDAAMCLNMDDAALISDLLLDLANGCRADYEPVTVIKFAAELKAVSNAGKIAVLFCDSPNCRRFHNETVAEELARHILELRPEATENLSADEANGGSLGEEQSILSPAVVEALKKFGESLAHQRGKRNRRGAKS